MISTCDKVFPNLDQILSSATPIMESILGFQEGAQIWVSENNPCRTFVNTFVKYIIGMIWSEEITLNWVKNRLEDPVLNWNILYR
jgi:glyoxylate utilization-related uncharacterized protein